VSLSQKGNLAGTLSTHPLQVESIVPAAQNVEKVNVTSLCFLCSYVKMDVFWSKQEVMNDCPVHLFIRPLASLSTRYLVTLFTCQLVNLPSFVNFSAVILTLRVPFLSTTCSPCRKKSILAEVCFDARRA